MEDNVLVALTGTPKEDSHKDHQQLQDMNGLSAKMGRQSSGKPTGPIQTTDGDQRGIREQVQRRRRDGHTLDHAHPVPVPNAVSPPGDVSLGLRIDGDKVVQGANRGGEGDEPTDEDATGLHDLRREGKQGSHLVHFRRPCQATSRAKRAASLSGGRRTTCAAASISMPRYVRHCEGPAVFSAAKGTPM